MRKIILTLLMACFPLWVHAANYEITTPGNNVGIGSVNPGQTLDVNGTIRAIGNITAPSFVGTAVGKSIFPGNVVVSGNVGILTISPQASLDVAGTIQASGTINPQGGVNWTALPLVIPNQSTNWTDFQLQQSSTAGVNWYFLDNKTGGTNWYAVADGAAATDVACWKANGQLGKCTTSITGVLCATCS